MCFLRHHSCHYAHSALGLNLTREITVLHLAGNNVSLGILIRAVAGISCQNCRSGSGRAHHCVHEAYVSAVSAHSAEETGIALIGHGEVADEMALTVKVDSETVFGIGCVQRLPFKTGHVDVLVQAEIHHGVLLQHIAHVIQLGGTHYAVRIVFCAITGRIAVSLVMNRLFQTSEQVLNLLVVIVLCGIDLCRLFADNLRCLHIQSKAARRSDFLIHSSNLFGQGSIELLALRHTILCQMGGQQQRVRSGSGRCLLRQFCQTCAVTFIEDVLACDNLLAHAYIRFQYRHTGS